MGLTKDMHVLGGQRHVAGGELQGVQLGRSQQAQQGLVDRVRAGGAVGDLLHLGAAEDTQALDAHLRTFNLSRDHITIACAHIADLKTPRCSSDMRAVHIN